MKEKCTYRYNPQKTTMGKWILVCYRQQLLAGKCRSRQGQYQESLNPSLCYVPSKPKADYVCKLRVDHYWYQEKTKFNTCFVMHFLSSWKSTVNKQPTTIVAIPWLENHLSFFSHPHIFQGMAFATMHGFDPGIVIYGQNIQCTIFRQ